jgi:hypothetical protein
METPRRPIDLEFVKARLADIARCWLEHNEAPLLTPSQLFMVLNRLLSKGQWPGFASPGHMALELVKLGLRSQVRTVEGRSERRWYDLAEYAKP